jgi:hypothetical protein
MQVSGNIKRQDITMNVMTRACLAAILMGIVTAGCDKPTPPPDLASAPPAPAAPTTQELLEGPRQPLNLVVSGLTAKVPPGWEIKRPDTGEFVFMHGAAPHGDVDIQVSRLVAQPQASLDQTQIQTLVAAAKKEMTQNPANHLVADLRDVNGLQCLEEVMADSPTTQPADVSDNSICTWRTIVFVPRAGRFDEVSLSVLGFTMGQYRQDGPFIRAIFNSILPEAAATPAAAPM